MFRKMFFLGLLLCAVIGGYAQQAESEELFGQLQPNEKGAVLMVHFGTTYDETRAKTLDALNESVRQAFPQVDVKEAYTSRIVIRRLKAKGIEKHNPIEMLQQLKKEGYTHVLIQSSNIIEGIEMNNLRSEAAAMQAQFKEIRVSRPLLYTPADYAAVIKAIQPKALQGGATILVGHGTSDAMTAQYAMLDYMLKAEGYADIHVATIEGYPTEENAEALVKASGKKRIRLIPFLMVAGDHANNDIAVDWKETFESKGYTVEAALEGLAENEEIRQIVVEHARQAAAHRPLNIAKEKRQYASQKD